MTYGDDAEAPKTFSRLSFLLSGVFTGVIPQTATAMGFLLQKQ